MDTLTRQIARYITTRTLADWSPEAVDKIKIHIADTVTAMLSGRHLPAGQRALAYFNLFGRNSAGRSRILGTGEVAAPEMAALINGMFAHADETDDTSESARMHPGASIVPAAFAVAEWSGADSRAILNAILIGYQVGIAFPQAVWADAHDRMHSPRATHNVGQIMGAVAAAGSILGLNEDQMVYALSYAAQQTSGVNSLYRERQHVEKAYVFGGLPAEQGTKAALFAHLGFTGVEDVMDTSISFFDSFAGRSAPDELMAMIEDPLGGVFQADIKLYPVGLPIQAAAQAMDELLSQGEIAASKVLSVRCHLPSQKAYIVDNRDMPPICLQYVLATMIEDGELTFANSHDQARLDRERQSGLMSRVELVHDTSMDPTDPGGSRNRADLLVQLRDGSTLNARVDELKGTRFAPATWVDLQAKTNAVLGSSAHELTEIMAQIGISLPPARECTPRAMATGTKQDR